MADARIIMDVCATMRDVLIQSVESITAVENISFDSPAAMTEPASETTAISLFLLRISPNEHYKNEQRIRIADDQMTNPPGVFDLTFLITPYASTRLQEQIMVEEILSGFGGPFSVLQEDTLSGSLVEYGNTKLRVYPRELTLDDLSKLWATFPNKALKLSLCFEASPVKIPSVLPAATIVPAKAPTISIDGVVSDENA